MAIPDYTTGYEQSPQATSMGETGNWGSLLGGAINSAGQYFQSRQATQTARATERERQKGLTERSKATWLWVGGGIFAMVALVVVVILLRK